MLDSTRLRGELNHIHRTLASVTASPRGKGLVDHLRREIDGTTTAMLWQSLFSDCLRVAYSAAAADGVIGDDEIAALYEFVFSVARHYSNVLPSYREFSAIDEDSIRQFLEQYAKDSGPFGERATHHWPGLTLCRRASDLGEPEALERYERMMSWLIPVACEIGGVTENDPRWGSRVAELHGLRRTLANTAAATASAKPKVDPRLQVFLGHAGVFAGVQQAASVFEADPFDVEKIHHDARVSFEQMVERAITPARHAERGRILLVLGESGSGKTHLLRGFRHHVQEFGRGFVAYAQMSSAAANYARYLLQHVVDSLSRPYTGPSGERTGLLELASGLARLVEEPLRSEILSLAEGEWEGQDPLRDHVNRLVDSLLAHAQLAQFDPDLLRVLLHALYPDQRTTSRAYKYLRCEDMNAEDRRWIGDVMPRNRDEHPIQMIRDLARLAFLTRKAALVLMLDQAELTGYDAASSDVIFKRAIDTLYSIVSEVPTAVAVVACISDLYEKVRNGIGRSMLDRLEKDPPSERLLLNRSYPEIEAIVGRRLSWLYAQNGISYKPEEPVYPIPPSELRNLTNRRTRDVLQWCHQFQARCADAKRIIEPTDLTIVALPTPPVGAGDDVTAAAWNDACHASGIEVPDSDDGILDAVATAARAAAAELGLSLEVQSRKPEGLRLQLTGATEKAVLLLAVTNRNYHRGAFGKQITTLRDAAGTAVPVAIRTLEFPKGAASEAAVGQLVKGGGKRAYLDSPTLRMLVAFQKFSATMPADQLASWQRRDRPISTLPPMNDLFDLQRLCGAPAAPTEPAPADAARVATPTNGTPIVPSGEAPAANKRAAKTPAAGVAATATNAQPGVASNASNAPTGVASNAPTGAAARPHGRRAQSKPGHGKTPPDGIAAAATTATATATTTAAAAAAAAAAMVADAPPLGSQLHVGTASTFSAEPRTIEISSLLRHTGILGSSGSGKTTLALNLIEQVLERDVAVILVDRKGDLAGYAKPDWWKRTAEPERARALAARIDVRLFTPGTSGGRPLALSVVPDLQNVPEHERDRMVQYAANALAAMMDSDTSASRAILTQAIAVLAERKRPYGLNSVIDLIESRDDQLTARASRYDDKLFRKLVQELETVRLRDGHLFDPKAEPLTAETLLGRKPDGKVPLTIISTKFLGDVEQVQSWVAHLIACLSRHATQSPSAELCTLFMIDEADVFMPAGASKPPSKEPLQDLLKRARAAGLGIILASQSPADFDYRSREQINTWLLGRIADQRSIDKMRPLFENKPTVGGKLGTQDQGRFVLLQDGGTVDLDRTPSLLRTEQLAEPELMALAAQNRGKA
jgi:ABC-type cobalamin/Fe3+-siderophores transport system ATPase subunit